MKSLFDKRNREELVVDFIGMMKDVRDQMRSRRFLFAVKNDLNEYCSHFFEKSENLLDFLLISPFFHAIFFFEVKGK